jgi:hypothetical protein
MKQAGLVAVFKPTSAAAALIDTTMKRLKQKTAMVRVKLKCDFLVDAKEKRPVDGNFLRGTMPTGDGVPGGDFDSWFFLGAKG